MLPQSRCGLGTDAGGVLGVWVVRASARSVSGPWVWASAPSVRRPVGAGVCSLRRSAGERLCGELAAGGVDVLPARQAHGGVVAVLLEHVAERGDRFA